MLQRLGFGLFAKVRRKYLDGRLRQAGSSPDAGGESGTINEYLCMFIYEFSRVMFVENERIF